MTPAGSSVRTVEVDPDRVAGWLTRFSERHGETSCQGDLSLGPEGSAVVRAADGATATLTAFGYDPLAVLLVRRGGYALGFVVSGGLVAHKVGSRHVQSRTAAGGWSQQRFARRRANQADTLVEAVAGHAAQVLFPAGPAARALVVGGDRTLVRAVLTGPRLGALGLLPRRELFDIPDPNRKVLDAVVRRARTVRILVTDQLT
jgi:hypothetical protein